MGQYESIIVNLLNASKTSVEKTVEDCLQRYYVLLTERGTLWVITNTVTSDGEFIPRPFDIVERLSKYRLKNIILVPTFTSTLHVSIFRNDVYYILFFSKNEEYFFDKDPIREKHIWKNVEWGRRKKNYHPLGKDPGNVWLKTEDNGQGEITQHIPLTFEEVVTRVVKCSTPKRAASLLVNIACQVSDLGSIKVIYE